MTTRARAGAGARTSGRGWRGRNLLELAGGMLDGRQLKFFCPGGSSTPILPASAVDTPYTYEDIAAAGSLLGTGALMFYSDQTSVVSVVRRFTEFY